MIQSKPSCWRESWLRRRTSTALWSWLTMRESTGTACALPLGVIKYLEDHTEHSEGNFHFAAGAFPPAVAPFFPVSQHNRRGTRLCYWLGVGQHRAAGVCQCQGRSECSR